MRYHFSWHKCFVIAAFDLKRNSGALQLAVCLDFVNPKGGSQITFHKKFEPRAHEVLEGI